MNTMDGPPVVTQQYLNDYKYTGKTIKRGVEANTAHTMCWEAGTNVVDLNSEPLQSVTMLLFPWLTEGDIQEMFFVLSSVEE